MILWSTKGKEEKNKFRDLDSHIRVPAATDCAEVRRPEELPLVQGQGRGPRRATPHRGAMTAWAQEGSEEPLHVQGQEGWW